MPTHVKRIFWHVLLWLNWLLILWFWWQGSGQQLAGAGTAMLLVILGRLAGLTAAYMVLLQFTFMGRNPWLEGVFGLDKLSRIHRTAGTYGLLVLLLHPVLILLGYSLLTGVSWPRQFVEFFLHYEDVNWAILGAGLFIVVVACSLYIVRKHLRYESWYFVHLLAYAAVFSSFWHQIGLGEDLVGNRLFYGYWILLYAAVFSSHLAFRFIRPLVNFFRHRFHVDRIQRENYNTVSVYISARNLGAFNIRPGQFMILRFLRKGLWWQAHPFSLSLVPGGKFLRVTIKELGDFTRQVASVPPGTEILIDGPYGVFTDLFSLSDKVLMIAGGIGITPIRSLSEQMAGNNKDIILLYANRSQRDIVFQSELDAIAAAHPNLKIHHILSDDPAFAGEKGYVDAEKIKKLAADLHAREVYLCGPPPMMDKLVVALRGLGIARSKIHFEKFSLH